MMREKMIYARKDGKDMQQFGVIKDKDGNFDRCKKCNGTMERNDRIKNRICDHYGPQSREDQKDSLR